MSMLQIKNVPIPNGEPQKPVGSSQVSNNNALGTSLEPFALDFEGLQDQLH